VLSPPEEKAVDFKSEDKLRIDQALSKAVEAARAASINPTPDSVNRSFQAQQEAATELSSKALGNPQVENNPWKFIMDIPAKFGEIAGQVGKAFVDGVTSFFNGVAAFGRGIWYGIVGPPPDEDLSDEIAALKGVGLALMTGGGATAAASAATGVGLPVAAAAGAASLIGWALTDNFAGRLEFIQSQRETEKRQKQYLKEKEETEKRIKEYEIQKSKEYYEWLIQQKAKSLEEQRKLLEEKEKKLEEMRKAQEEYWRKVAEERAKAEEERRKEEEEDRKLYAAQTSIRALLDEIKGLQQAAGNAYFAKAYDTAVQLMGQVRDKVQELKARIEQHKEILEKNGLYGAYMDQARALENVAEATLKAWTGRNPNREVVNAVVNYQEATQQFNRAVAKQAEAISPISLHVKDDVDYVRKVMRIERKNAAVGKLLSDWALNWLSQIPIVVYSPSKLSPATIAKLRSWLMKVKRTPLAAIPGWRWNQAAGYDYTPEMLALMDRALRQAGVSWKEVRNVRLRDLEAILRARQYIYQVAKRGYWHPYELELYGRLKELLQLTDYQAAKMFRV
jgi:hypothetical protein